MKFRNTNDEIHFFGSFTLTVIAFILFLIFTDIRCFVSLALSIVIINFLGFIWEWLEDQVFVHWSNTEYWEHKPEWMHNHFSGDDWDWQDIKLNFYGTTIVLPISVIISYLFIEED